MASKTFVEMLDRMRAIHELKNADYAAESNPYENFERAAILGQWFTDPVDKVFAIMIGIKLARLANLYSKEGKPNNESTEDSHLDSTVYSGLWAAYRKDRVNLQKKEVQTTNRSCDYCGRPLAIDVNKTEVWCYNPDCYRFSI